MVLLYLNQSHSEADTQDHPDVGEEPALHTGSTTLIKKHKTINPTAPSESGKQVTEQQRTLFTTSYTGQSGV